MAEYKSKDQVNVGWGLSLSMSGKAPAIANRIYETKADAEAFITSDTTEIAGIILRVVGDTADNNGAYLVEKNGESLKLTKLATGGEATEYVAGDGIKIEDASISVKLAEGSKLEFKDGALDVSLGDIDSSLAALDSAIKSLDSSVAVLDSSVKALDSSVKADEVKIGALDSSVKSLDSSVAALETSVNAIDSSVKALDSSVKADEAKIANLDSSVKALDSSVAALETSVSALDSSVKVLDSSVVTLESSVKALDSSVKTLDTSVVAIEKELENKVDSSEIYEKSVLDASYNTLKGLASGAFHFKGVVATVDDLPDDASEGWVYEVLEKQSEYAYTIVGDASASTGIWVELGSKIDLSEYYTKSEIDSSVISYVASQLVPYAKDASVKALDASVKADEAKLEKLDSSVSALDSAVKALDASVKADEAEIANLDASVKAIDSSVSALDSSVKALDSSVVALDASVKVLDTSVVSLASELKELDASIVEDEKVIAASLVDLNSRISKDASTIENIDASVKANEAKIANLDSSVSVLDSSVKALDSSVSSIETALSAIDSSIKELKQKDSSLDSSIKVLDSSVKAIESEISKLDSSVVALEAKDASLDASIKEIAAKLSDASIAAWNAGEANVIESINLNGLDFNIGDSKDASLVIGGSDILITGYDGTIAVPTDDINSALKKVANAIQSAQAGSVSSVNGAVGVITIAGDADSYISVDSSVDSSYHQITPTKVSATLSELEVDSSGNVTNITNGLVTNSVMEDYVDYRFGWETL